MFRCNHGNSARRKKVVIGMINEDLAICVGAGFFALVLAIGIWLL